MARRVEAFPARVCACGCEAQLVGRDPRTLYDTPACRARAYRARWGLKRPDAAATPTPGSDARQAGRQVRAHGRRKPATTATVRVGLPAHAAAAAGAERQGCTLRQLTEQALASYLASLATGLPVHVATGLPPDSIVIAGLAPATEAPLGGHLPDGQMAQESHLPSALTTTNEGGSTS